MRDSITDVPGIRIGHAQNLDTARGVTVMLCENAKTAGVDVRGGSPGTRETDCLAPVNMVPAPHAIYFSGGSAFGLAGAGGVMKYFRDKKIGFNAWNVLVPIVSGAVIFDLTVGDPLAYPDEAMGYQACENAGLDVPMGVVGAGTGALIGWAGDLDQRMKGGLGTASASSGNLVVGALVVVNCWGNVGPGNRRTPGRNPEQGEKRSLGRLRGDEEKAGRIRSDQGRADQSHHHRHGGDQRDSFQAHGHPGGHDGP